MKESRDGSVGRKEHALRGGCSLRWQMSQHVCMFMGMIQERKENWRCVREMIIAEDDILAPLWKEV